MIREICLDAALWALNDLLVTARAMAYEQRPHAQVARFLDAVEEPPTLLARKEDLTDDDRSALDGITQRVPDAEIALLRFDRLVPP